jgi:hypothetical protein
MCYAPKCVEYVMLRDMWDVLSTKSTNGYATKLVDPSFLVCSTIFHTNSVCNQVTLLSKHVMPSIYSSV